jgi:hypothetical protein
VINILFCAEKRASKATGLVYGILNVSLYPFRAIMPSFFFAAALDNKAILVTCN